MIVSNKLILFTLFFILSITQVHGADKMMLLDFDEIQNLELDEVNNIRKSTIEIVAFSKKFNLVLAKVNKKTLAQKHVWYEVKVEIKRVNIFESSMKMSLIEMPSGHLINIVQEPKVTNLKLQYRARMNVLKLLFGKNFNEENGEVINDEIIPLDEYINERGVRIEVDKKNKKNIYEPNKLEDKAPELDPESEDKDKKNPPPPEEPVPAVVKKGPPKKYPVTISKFESPNLNLSKEAIKPIVRKSKINKYSFNYMLGLEKEYIESTNQFVSNEQVELVVNLDRLIVGFGINVAPEDSDGSYGFGLMLSKNVGENEYGVSPKYLLTANYDYDLYNQNIFVGAFAEFERSGYINIRNRGSGIENIDSNLLWMGIGAKLVFNLFGAEVETSAKLMKTFIANSNLGIDKKSVQMDGSKFQITAGSKIYKKIGIEFAYENVDVSSMILSKIETKHSVTTVKLVYN